MKNNKPLVNKKIMQVAGIAALLSLSCSAISFNAHAAVDEERQESSSESRRSLDDMIAKGNSANGRAKLVEVAQKLSMSADDLANFFRGEVSKGSDLDAWATIITKITTPKANMTAADFADLDITAEGISSYISLKNSGLAENVRVSETDLAVIATKWTPNQRANFTKVLRRAALDARSGRVVTTEDAFEQSVKELGFWEKLNMCKI